jgi:hypothetical protein
MARGTTPDSAMAHAQVDRALVERRCIRADGDGWGREIREQRAASETGLDIRDDHDRSFSVQILSTAMVANIMVGSRPRHHGDSHSLLCLCH